MKIDAVQQLLQVVATAAHIDHAALARADTAIRREFGGAALRIQPKAPVTIDEIDSRLRARKPVAMIAHEVGLSRATIYRMLGRRKSKSRTPAQPCDNKA
jgi:DNA invertase Pin-like site-specific DNA recombinase